DEAGMTFWSPTGEGFGRERYSGTAHLAGAPPFSLSFKASDDSLFGIISVQLAGYNADLPDVPGSFVGHRSDGSTVRTDFPVSGFVFQTFYFGPEFNNLTRVDVLSFGSLDNLVVLIPEPSTWCLLAMLGLPAFVLWRRGVRRR
ncbi:MAG TPA: hypothetical protein PKA41_10865, partial [Verrucomicrobiota bacterium]|nr:hypothetical protein [Verrucomicrobiota bacterium]